MDCLLKFEGIKKLLFAIATANATSSAIVTTSAITTATATATATGTYLNLYPIPPNDIYTFDGISTPSLYIMPVSSG